MDWCDELRQKKLVAGTPEISVKIQRHLYFEVELTDVVTGRVVTTEEGDHNCHNSLPYFNVANYSIFATLKMS